MTELRKKMEEAGIDAERSEEILAICNDPDYTPPNTVVAREIPGVDGTKVIDRAGLSTYTLPEERYRRHLAEVAPEVDPDRYGVSNPDGTRTLSLQELTTLGVLLYPYLSYGVLNGGSASSYADRIKNAGFDESLFHLYEAEFQRLAPEVTGKPKGVTPAFVNPDGTAGPSFLELKFRMILRAGRLYRETAASEGVTPPEGLKPVLPFFEMTSGATDQPLREAYQRYRHSPLLADLDDRDVLLDTLHARQPLLAALTHRGDGRPLSFFLTSGGEPLGFPGGHGQNFQVLGDIYRTLLSAGKRFVYLGNVDNIGFTVDPVSLAITALSGAPAGFDFAFRTPVDVKGGILVRDDAGHLNCADIGPAISREEVLRQESEGNRILFNCATGLFDLRHLCANRARIVRELPLRVSDQEKDVGRYSQAEQVTWEVIALLDSPLIFGIDKYQRFLAAKMLLETLLTSGLKKDQATLIQPTAVELHQGLQRVLKEQYGLVLRDQRWQPG